MRKIICSNCDNEVILNSKQRCPLCNKKNTIEVSEEEPSYRKPPIMEKTYLTGVGWLIVHTEGKESVTHLLKEGKNFIGRTTESNTADIPVEGDKYVSRYHAVLNVIKNNLGYYHYFLTDNDENGGKRTDSLNGTYLNGNLNRLSSAQQFEMKDRDTVQIGETKLVLKTPETVADQDEAETEVHEMDYEATVIINK